MSAALPSRLEEDRWFLTPVSVHGESFNLYTDTAGGIFLFSDAVHQHFLETFQVHEDGLEREAVRLPEFQPGRGIPAPISPAHLYVVFNYQRQTLTPGWQAFRGWSGMLGARWFAGRRWMLDYPGKRFLVDAEPPAAGARLPLGLAAPHNYPRVAARIEGEDLDLLLDTGAMTELNGPALGKIADGRSKLRAASLIVAEVFQAWRKRHPSWRVLEAAEMGTDEPMIEVPDVELGGLHAGPVWFTARPDAKYREWMSQWTDRPVSGALGGNALRQFRVTLDYPAAAMYLERP
ncbi:MAG: hypothetical protein HYY18_05385 [Planctomycetes bacterium]|nr:hypothetical protein [Planctomycetota bacterium]